MNETRPLGRTDLGVSALVFGTMARSQTDPDSRRTLFRHAIARGITTFDTAPLYAFGDTERHLGSVLGELPDAETQVLGKVGLNWRGDHHGPIHFKTVGEDGRQRIVRRDSRPEAVRLDVEESLKRLDRECLDLAQVHFRDTDTPIAETMQALADLRREGKIREIGVSNFTLDEVREAKRALGTIPLASVQLRLNLLQRTPLDEGDIVPWCLENQVGVLAYSPLAEGRLAKSPRELKDIVDQALSRLSSLAAEGAVKEISMATLAIAWLLEERGVTGAVVGASSSTQLDSLLRTTEVSTRSLDAMSAIFRGIHLSDSYETPAWKRGLRRLKQKVLRVSL